MYHLIIVEQEIIAARDENCLIMMELDVNAKLGYKKSQKIRIQCRLMAQYFGMLSTDII